MVLENCVVYNPGVALKTLGLKPRARPRGNRPQGFRDVSERGFKTFSPHPFLGECAPKKWLKNSISCRFQTFFSLFFHLFVLLRQKQLKRVFFAIGSLLRKAGGSLILKYNI